MAQTIGECNALVEKFKQTRDSLRDSNQKLGKIDLKDEKEWFQQYTVSKNMDQAVIDIGRSYLGNCPNASINNQSIVLEEIGKALVRQQHLDDSVPILKRCVSLTPENSVCWENLGFAESRMCNFDSAEDDFKKVIEIGGFTDSNALMVEEAKAELRHLLIFRKMPDLPATWNCPAQDKSSEVQTAQQDAKVRFGTGFFVSKDGYILTNDHVVNGCKTISTRDGAPLTVASRQPGSDLALLKAVAKPAAVASFRTGTPPRVGDATISFGFPLPGILSPQGNTSTGVISATGGPEDDARFIQISAPIQPGNSGGPLLDDRGNVIGVIVAKLDALRIAAITGDVPQNVNFAVHWAEVRAFLDEAGVSYIQSSGKRTEIHTIAEKATEYTVAISCAE